MRPSHHLALLGFDPQPPRTLGGLMQRYVDGATAAFDEQLAIHSMGFWKGGAWVQEALAEIDRREAMREGT